MRQILDFGEVRRGLLGVTITTIDEEGAKALGAKVNSGALVSNIEPGSAAEQAGLLVDDIIVRVDDKRIDDSRELANAIGLKGSGEEVKIEFVRGGEERFVTAVLGQQSAVRSAGTDIHPGLVGAQFASSSTSGTGGVDVTEVEAGSPAAQRGLRSGDTIIAVNRRSVGDLRELRSVSQGNRILFLLVQRGDRQLMLQIR
jgi:S1-C subfamily serine protease